MILTIRHSRTGKTIKAVKKKKKSMVVKGYGEGSGTPLQYSCLENPMDGGAW